MGARETQWWYTDRAGRHGPVSEQKLLELIRARSLSPDAAFWTEGLSKWKQLAEVETLFSTMAPGSPMPAVSRRAEAVPRAEEGIAEPLGSPYAPPRTKVEDAATSPAAIEGHLNVPWRRWFARQLDWFLFSLPAAFLFGVLLGVVFGEDAVAKFIALGNGWPFLLLCLPLGQVFMAVSAKLFGGTPGKWLLALKIQKLEGSATLGDYVSRELRCWLYGNAAGLPFVCLIPYMHNYSRVKEGGRPSWDEATGFAVTGRRPLGAWRVIAFLLAFALLALTHAALAEVGGL